jgi:sigma-E factor negative regulatory protein RseA
MTDSVEEQVSALLDSEVSAEELDLLLSRIDRDDGNRRRLARYALIGAALRAERVGGNLEFANRVRAAIAHDRTNASPAWRPAAPSRIRTAWFSTAAAAMVAGLAVLLAPLWSPVPDTLPSVRVAAVTKPAVRAPARVAANTDSSAVRRAMKPRHMMAKASPIPADRLATYVASHGAYAASLSQSSWDTRVVNGELERVSWQVESPSDAL